jgi:creatinine amidohydrolase
MTFIAADSWRFTSHTRNELNELAKSATLVLPLGSTEQHGHHLPVAVDAAIVTHLAEQSVALASREAPILLLPTQPFGFAQHHVPFGGTISINSGTYVDLLTDICVGLREQGFKRIIFLNGHGGNETPMRLVTDKLLSQLKLDLHLSAGSYWHIAERCFIDLGFPTALAPGHAGHFETSLMLAIAPELVHMERRPKDATPMQPLAAPGLPGAYIRRPQLWEKSDGRTDDASMASGDLGARLLPEMIKEIAAFIVKFHKASH